MKKIVFTHNVQLNLDRVLTNCLNWSSNNISKRIKYDRIIHLCFYLRNILFTNKINNPFIQHNTLFKQTAVCYPLTIKNSPQHD